MGAEGVLIAGILHSAASGVMLRMHSRSWLRYWFAAGFCFILPPD
jgi:hypothetical protein